MLSEAVGARLVRREPVAGGSGTRNYSMRPLWTARAPRGAGLPQLSQGSARHSCPSWGWTGVRSACGQITASGVRGCRMPACDTGRRSRAGLSRPVHRRSEGPGEGGSPAYPVPVAAEKVAIGLIGGQGLEVVCGAFWSLNRLGNPIYFGKGVGHSRAGPRSVRRVRHIPGPHARYMAAMRIRLAP